MSIVDREVVLEALSALLQTNVKPVACYSGSKKELQGGSFFQRGQSFNTSLHHVDSYQSMPFSGGGSSTNASSQQNPVFNSLSLRPISFYSGGSSTNTYSHQHQPLLPEISVDPDEFFDPCFDYDFTNTKDDTIFMRGNEKYKRPCGCYRIALKVLNKYPDGNTWLGTAGWRSHSVAGEWPVSYHGTSVEGATGIAKSHYKAGHRQLYGRGIYSTYDIKEALDYSKQFISKKNGKTYKVLFQNRINPEVRKVCEEEKYWLIEIPEGTSADEEKKIVEKSIRPYGILLKEV